MGLLHDLGVVPLSLLGRSRHGFSIIVYLCGDPLSRSH